jgi:hypothetical protein
LNLNGLYDTNTLSRLANAFKLHNACGKCKECVVTADANIDAGMKLCAALTHEDVAGEYYLTAKAFNPEALGITFAAVSRTSAAFFMSHTTSPI